MKRRHALALDDFEASSVILFAALVADSGPTAPAGRAASRPAVSPDTAPSRAAAKHAGREPQRPAAAAGGARSQAGDAVTIAIDQFTAGRVRGFVPFRHAR